jgi:hypothetical protein
MGFQIKFGSFEDEYYHYLRDEILSHHLSSGEIILIINSYSPKTKELKELMFEFFENNNIKTSKTEYHKKNLRMEDLEITKEQAVEIITYALSTKINYTKIDKEFEKPERKRFAFEVINLFNYPKFYTLSSDWYDKLWIRELDINDFWKGGGAIIIDNDKIGIFWVNDLYDQY